MRRPMCFAAGIVNEVAFFLAPVVLGTERAALSGAGPAGRLALKEPVGAEPEIQV